MQYVDYRDRQSLRIGPLEVLPVPVVHPSGATPYALRIAAAGRTIGFSGDTEWTPALVEAASGTDLFVCECYGFDKPIRFHMHYTQLRTDAARLGTRRLLLTHLGREALAHASEIGFEIGEDGQDIEL